MEQNDGNLPTFFRGVALPIRIHIKCAFFASEFSKPCHMFNRLGYYAQKKFKTTL